MYLEPSDEDIVIVHLARDNHLHRIRLQVMDSQNTANVLVEYLTPDDSTVYQKCLVLPKCNPEGVELL